ncbi:MAG TPA: glycosyltransferase [Solirubrobacterales bacterium]|nr:glycosyltransferase [Solirubrobacterales bacterium]
MTRARPVLSVVVPTKGRPRYLERCLAALAAAEYAPQRFEVVVVDDSPGDEVQGVVSAAPRALALRRVRPRHTGPSAARNAGAFGAHGKLVTFTDDDCEPSPGWLAALERAMRSNPGFAVGGRTLNGAPGDTAAASQAIVDAVHAGFARDPAVPRFFASYNVAFPAEDFRELGGFDEAFRYAEDRELCERWVRSGRRFVYAPDAIVVHMRTLTLREFWGQHYGYGRGAWAFRREQQGQAGPAADSRAVLRAVGRAMRESIADRRLGMAGCLALSQLATASGFLREAATRGASRG